MSNKVILVLVLNILLLQLDAFVYFHKHRSANQQSMPPSVPIDQTLPPTPRSFSISVKMPSYLPYDKVVEQLRTWNKEAPGITEIGTYGKTSRGQDLYYLRVGESRAEKKVMITACIHGNEPLATGTVMAYVGALLSGYGVDPQITQILQSRQVYFVPVVSPDSYPSSRFVDGVDPNRNFPTVRDPDKQSVAPLAALQRFFLQHRFSAAISGHTHGRVYMIPWGDSTQNCPDYEVYRRIVENMLSVTGTSNDNFRRPYGELLREPSGRIAVQPAYTMIRGCEMYRSPIFGTEMDWYYRHGAFAMVIEYGTHQHTPSMQDIQYEFGLTWKAIQVFLKEAPDANLQLHEPQSIFSNHQNGTYGGNSAL